MPTGQYARKPKAPAKPAPTKPTRPVGEKILPDTTSDNPVMPAPAEAAAPPTPVVQTTEAMVLNEKTQRYEKKTIPIESLTEPKDRFGGDQMGLGLDWDRGRGRDMHAYWANANPKYRVIEGQLGYRPVDPKEVPAEIRSRYMVEHVDGYDGECLVFGDAVLVECPQRDKQYRDARREKDAKTKKAELWGFGSEIDKMNDAHGNDARHDIEAHTAIGGHIDDLDPGRRGVRYGSQEMYEQQADAEIEAEYGARGGPTFGGFQGTPQYNQTSWSRDSR